MLSYRDLQRNTIYHIIGYIPYYLKKCSFPYHNEMPRDSIYYDYGVKSLKPYSEWSCGAYFHNGSIYGASRPGICSESYAHARLLPEIPTPADSSEQYRGRN